MTFIAIFSYVRGWFSLNQQTVVQCVYRCLITFEPENPSQNLYSMFKNMNSFRRVSLLSCYAALTNKDFLKFRGKILPQSSKFLSQMCVRNGK